MITSEDLRQLSRIARILGSPLHGLRLYCDASIEGLQDVKGVLNFRRSITFWGSALSINLCQL
eukprot:12882080-Prorocentrum_lima.AAC.1